MIIAANDNVGGSVGDLLPNAVTDDATPTIRGTGTDGDIITLYNSGVVIGTATVAGGTWSITPGAALANGNYTLTATATDAAGNISSSSNSISFTVNTTPLTAPLVTNIEDNVGVITGTLGNGSVTDDLSPTVSGTGTPGSTILIYDNGNLIPLNITVGADGKWSVDVPLSANAQHTLTFGAQDAAGNSLPAANPIVITTDTQAPGAPAVDTIDNNGTLVSGTAEPGSTVIIRNGTTVLGQAVADSNTGAYTVTISPAQTAGESLNAIAQDPAGSHPIMPLPSTPPRRWHRSSPALSMTFRPAVGRWIKGK